MQSNLINYIHHILTAVQRNLQVDAIYKDFQKASDKVNRKILVTKLGKIGFSDTLVTLSHVFNWEEAIRKLQRGGITHL